MTMPLPVDFLLVSRAPTVDLAMIVAAIGPLRPGMIVEIPAPTPDYRAGREQRQTLGRVAIHETLARVDLTMTCGRHPRPVLADMPAEVLARLTRRLDPTQLATVRAGTWAIDLHADIGDADRAWCLRWIMRIVAAVAAPLEALAFDPAAQVLWTPPQLHALVDAGLDRQVTLHREPWGPETCWLHTHGLQKLGQPEIEVVEVPLALGDEAETVLRQIIVALAATPASDGPSLRAGMRVECAPGVELMTRVARHDPDHAAPWGRLRLVTLPAPGMPPVDDANAAIIATALASISQEAQQNWPTAMRRLDHILVAAPDDAGPRAMRARAWLRMGEPAAALDAARTLELLAPGDARGPLCAAQALLALGRMSEARAAADEAISLDPGCAEAYLVRATLSDRLRDPAAAAADRARAAILAD